MTHTKTGGGPLGRRWLVRGESLIASAGLGIAAIVLLVAGGVTWWSVRTFERASSAEEGRAHERAASLISVGVESLLTAGEVSAARRLVIESARDPRVLRCRVVLPDGRVIASSSPSEIDLAEIPASWAGGVEETQDGRLRRRAIAVGERGEAACEVEFKSAEAGSWAWTVQGGALASVGVGMVLLLALYRRVRTRLGAIGAVREALLACGEGERDARALRVHAGFGAEAVAWNGVLDELESLRVRDREERAASGSGGRGAGASADQGVCDLLTQGILLIDHAGMVVYANGAAGLLLRRVVTELAGKAAGDAVGSAEVGEGVRRALAEGGRQRLVTEVRVGGEEGSSPSVLRVSVRAVRGREDVGALATIEDVTQITLAEQARSAFVAQATHELRTPLTNIRLYVEQAVEEGEQDAALRARALNAINQEARRLERIVGDMLSVSEIEAGSMSLRLNDVRLDQVFAELRADYEAPAAEKGLTLSFEVAPKLPVIKADRDRLTMALHNLVGNALKYTASGGSVRVRVDTEADGSLVVDVIDTGFGISQADQARVFERFCRANDERVAGITGSGIGLALARDVVRLHGGDITVESELNKGSTFTLRLPGYGAETRAA